MLALTWRRFTTAGAVVGIVVGAVSAIVLIVVSPSVWPGADSETGSPIGWTLTNPAIVSIPLGFLGCWVGTRLSPSTRSDDGVYNDMLVRAETGLDLRASNARG